MTGSNVAPKADVGKWIISIRHSDRPNEQYSNDSPGPYSLSFNLDPNNNPKDSKSTTVASVTSPARIALGSQIVVNYTRYGSVPDPFLGPRAVLVAGSYSVAPCTLDGSVTITPDSTSPSSPFHGSAQATTTGGVAPLTYGWSISGGTITGGQGTGTVQFDYDSGSAANPTTVTATCIVSDASGCTVTNSATYHVIYGGGGDGSGSGSATLWLSADRSATGRAARASTGADGKLLLSLAIDYLAQNWEDKPATFTAGRPCLRYDRHSARHRLRVSYEAGDGVETRTSDTEGVDWTMPTTITSAGKFPAFCITPTGAQHHFWISGSTVMSCVLDPQGHILMNPVAVASGAASDALAAWHNVDTGNLFLEYRAGNAIVTVRSTDAGKTFT